MARWLYVDPFSGASGDMLLGALVDAGLPIERLAATVDALDLAGVGVVAEPVVRRGLRGTHVRVTLPAAEANGHPHRGLRDLLQIVHAAHLPDRVVDRAEQVLRRLAEVEAGVHGTTVDAVHFHEVGAVDTLVDVVGTVIGLETLGVSRIGAGSLPVGRGTVRGAHGVLPVPPPAVAALTVGIPTRGVDLEGELVTPTGAALLATLVETWGPQPAMTVTRIGYGAGSLDFPIANLLRVFLGEAPEPDGGPDTVALLETNVDDMSPELYDHVAARLFAAGALDVWTAPITMKKGRPAQLVSVLCPPERATHLTDLLFAETTTFGVRLAELRRDRLERRLVDVMTPYGPVRIKMGYRYGQLVTASPEYESCRAAAERTGAPLKDVFAAARRAADDQTALGER